MVHLLITDMHFNFMHLILYHCRSVNKTFFTLWMMLYTILQIPPQKTLFLFAQIQEY